MKKDYFEDVFNDFFKESSHIEEKKTEEIKEEIKIDELNITDESKEILTKISTYIKEYNEEKRFIPFNLCVTLENENTIDKITNVLKSGSYLKNTIVSKVSMYEKDTLEDAYNKSGIVVINKLDALSMENVNDKKKTLYVLDELIKKNNETITILIGTNDEINTIFSINPDLKNKFLYVIDGIKPDIQDIYLDILKGLNKGSDVKLLDYIKATYDKSKLDYDLYKNNLIDYISLNGKLPELEKNKSLSEIFAELDKLVGLSDIKKTLKDLADLISLKKKSDEISIKDVNMHMVFLGNPGTGKTTVARLVKDILYNLGYIKENKLIEVTSKDLIGEYVGHTGPKTQSVIDRALGGVLFIDEAYTLSTSETNSYNQEAIMTLMEAMENKRNEIVVIFAGYTKEMQDFLNSNSGIASRVGYTLDFKDYTNEELIKIFENMMTSSGFIVEKDCLKELSSMIDKHRSDRNFGNARFVRNVYEKTIIKHANNTKKTSDKKILKTITKDDLSDEGLIG